MHVKLLLFDYNVLVQTVKEFDIVTNQKEMIIEEAVRAS